MIAAPNSKPVVARLNSYYLKLEKLVEHFQGELGAGCIYFKSSEAEGIIYFEADALLNGMFDFKGKTISGKRAIAATLKAASTLNFSVDIFELSPEEVYLWASMCDAKPIYKDLSTEFTDLQALVKKMASEHLTGSIQVSINDGKETGMLLFNNGRILSGFCSWGKSEKWNAEQMMEQIIQKTKDAAGIFTVNQIVPQQEDAKPLKREPIKKAAQKRKADPTFKNGISDALGMLKELLNQFEHVVENQKKLKGQFKILLNKKFIEKADQYDFLDPFAAEFEYTGGDLTFVGQASEMQLVMGVTGAVGELAREIGVYASLKEALRPWFDKYGKALDAKGINL